MQASRLTNTKRFLQRMRALSHDSSESSKSGTVFHSFRDLQFDIREVHTAGKEAPLFLCIPDDVRSGV